MVFDWLKIHPSCFLSLIFFVFKGIPPSFSSHNLFEGKRKKKKKKKMSRRYDGRTTTFSPEGTLCLYNKRY
jgi:hypothetical protein